VRKICFFITIFFGILIVTLRCGATQTTYLIFSPVNQVANWFPVASDTTEVIPAHIEDLLEHENLKEILSGLRMIHKGRIGAIMDSFSSANLNWVWKIREGSLPENVVAVTSMKGKDVETVLDSGKLEMSTNLFVASNLLHEMVHAYLCLYSRDNQVSACRDFPRVCAAWMNSRKFSLNSAHHEEMENYFIKDIAATLDVYSQNHHIEIDDEVCTDLAWGGLNILQSSHLSESDQQRILYRLAAELTNQVYGTVVPFGQGLQVSKQAAVKGLDKTNKPYCMLNAPY